MLVSDALEIFGTKAAIAEILGISSSAVTQWKEVVPEKQAYRLARFTRGKLKVDVAFYKKNNSVANSIPDNAHP